MLQNHAESDLETLSVLHDDLDKLRNQELALSRMAHGGVVNRPGIASAIMLGASIAQRHGLEFNTLGSSLESSVDSAELIDTSLESIRDLASSVGRSISNTTRRVRDETTAFINKGSGESGSLQKNLEDLRRKISSTHELTEKTITDEEITSAFGRDVSSYAITEALDRSLKQLSANNNFAIERGEKMLAAVSEAVKAGNKDSVELATKMVSLLPVPSDVARRVSDGFESKEPVVYGYVFHLTQGNGAINGREFLKLARRAKVKNRTSPRLKVPFETPSKSDALEIVNKALEVTSKLSEQYKAIDKYVDLELTEMTGHDEISKELGDYHLAIEILSRHFFRYNRTTDLTVRALGAVVRLLNKSL